MRPILLLLVLLSWCPWPALSQVSTGEIRLKVTDPTGAGVVASVGVISQGNQYSLSVATDAHGAADLHQVPYGLYQIDIQKPGFSQITGTVHVGSPIPVEYAVKLRVAPLTTVVDVHAGSTLLDPDQTSSVMQIGSRQIEDRLQSLPGRSVQDLVNSQPGWLYEGNAVLHPRGSEYQTQFVIDGIPLTDNRSPSFGPEIGADDLQSMTIYTAGFPAEYGRKVGGVVELNTRRDPRPGLHGQLNLSGGSFDTLGGYGQVQQTWGKNTVGGSASGGRSSHYLNPVVPENFTNAGTTGDFSTRYERNFTENDRLILSVRHELSRFEIPNELVQQQAHQLQTGDNFETLGSANYQHIFSPDVLGSVMGMVRNNANDLYSNASSTPIIAFQSNEFREGYLKGSVSWHRGSHEFKAGAEVDNTFLHEDFHYLITDPTQFDPETPATLEFKDHRPDLEQSAFVEDLVHLGNWTVSAGLRWDHYQLLLNEHAFSPRVSVGRYFRSANLVVHGSFDRIFQTPSSENILIASSPQIDALSSDFLRLPVQPSRGNYYEGGVTRSFNDRLRADVNLYRRNLKNFADDDQLLNTGVSYPVAFNRGAIYGGEAKLTLVRLQNLTGFVSYSYMVGNVWFPATGGLFLGFDASAAQALVNGHFPNSQDQRNTLRTRFQYRASSRVWIAGGAAYGSGLPFKYGGTEADALALYGPAVVSRVNFDRGRVRPMFSVSASLGVAVYQSEKMKAHLQLDGNDLNDRLNVLDFNGLFSGNAIEAPRSWSVRLVTSF